MTLLFIISIISVIICCCSVLLPNNVAHSLYRSSRIATSIFRQLSYHSVTAVSREWQRSALQSSTSSDVDTVVRSINDTQSNEISNVISSVGGPKLDDPTPIPPPTPKITVLLPSKQQPSYFRTKPSGEHVSWHHVFSKISDKIGDKLLYSMPATAVSRDPPHFYMQGGRR
jgi:hypothetical protein